MPKKPIDYSNSSIYKLCCRDTDITDCYVGSTTNFRTRKSQHKSSCNKENNRDYDRKVYQFIREHGGWENWDMILIEKVNVNDGNELHKEERKWVEQLNATLNCNLPSRTDNEWREENKETKKYYDKQYREENKERKKYNDKQYRENNEEYLKQYKKGYYEKNKKQILEKYKEKIQCPICNSISTKGNLKKHQKTMKCINASK